jgi:hypothetical protein
MIATLALAAALAGPEDFQGVWATDSGEHVWVLSQAIHSLSIVGRETMGFWLKEVPDGTWFGEGKIGDFGDVDDSVETADGGLGGRGGRTGGSAYGWANPRATVTARMRVTEVDPKGLPTKIESAWFAANELHTPRPGPTKYICGLQRIDYAGEFEDASAGIWYSIKPDGNQFKGTVTILGRTGSIVGGATGRSPIGFNVRDPSTGDSVGKLVIYWHPTPKRVKELASKVWGPTDRVLVSFNGRGLRTSGIASAK